MEDQSGKYEGGGGREGVIHSHSIRVINVRNYSKTHHRVCKQNSYSMYTVPHALFRKRQEIYRCLRNV